MSEARLERIRSHCLSRISSSPPAHEADASGSLERTASPSHHARRQSRVRHIRRKSKSVQHFGAEAKTEAVDQTQRKHSSITSEESTRGLLDGDSASRSQITQDSPSKGHRLHRRHPLAKEVERLKSLNMQLSESLGVAEMNLQSMQGELRKVQRRCSELEQLAMTGAISGEIATAISENDNLRKQLCAYSVEIDTLRSENEGLLRNVHVARYGEAAAATERDKLLAHGGRVYFNLNAEGCQLKEQLGRLSSDLMQKDRMVQELRGIVKPMHDKLRELQEAYVRQTAEYRDFVKGVQKRQQLVQRSFEDIRYEMAGHYDTIVPLSMSISGAHETVNYRLKGMHPLDLYDANFKLVQAIMDNEPDAVYNALLVGASPNIYIDNFVEQYRRPLSPTSPNFSIGILSRIGHAKLMTPLMLVCELGHAEVSPAAKETIAMYLLNAKAYIKSSDSRGWTPLCHALGAGEVHIADMIARHPGFNRQQQKDICVKRQDEIVAKCRKDAPEKVSEVQVELQGPISSLHEGSRPLSLPVVPHEGDTTAGHTILR